MKCTKKPNGMIERILFLILSMLLVSACGDVTESTLDSNIKETISSYDGNAIIQLKAQEFYEHDYVEAYRDKLVERYGTELVSSVNEASQKAKSNGTPSGGVILLKDLPSLKAKSSEQISSHLRLVDPSGHSEDFILGVRRYVQNASSLQEKNSGINQLSEENSWLALSPDRFYLQDDEEGNEIWPITFEAVNLADNTKSIEVTFDSNGFVSSTVEGQAKASNTSPNLMFVETMAVLDEPCVDDGTQFESCNSDGGGGSGGGSGGSSSRINDWTRGESTGTYCSPCTYLSVKSVRLAASGDGDGASDLQMFVKNNDDYNHNFPVSYKYRFDTAFRNNPVYGWSNNTLIEGADRGWPYYTYYEVPDIDHEGIDYSFANTRYYISHQGSGYNTDLPSYTDHFPLINLTQMPSAWRVVLVDDDKDYPDFSSRRADEHAKYVQTYHMNDGIWRNIYTGFTTKNHTYGSTDDGLEHSGVRRITQANANARTNVNGQIIAQKSYPNNQTFKYIFALSTY